MHQTNATTSSPGAFTYIPAEGEVLTAGNHTLSVTFTPADANFPAIQTTVLLTVIKAMPAITWLAPAPITYGTALGIEQLDATTSVPGEFFYAPYAGTVLTEGTQTLSVTFIPKDTTSYAVAQAAVTIMVSGYPNIISSTPATIYMDAEDNFDSLLPEPHSASVGSPKRWIEEKIESEDRSTGVVLMAKVPMQLAPLDTASYIASGDAERRASQSAGISSQHSGRETRSYKGATYEKGADGQWHLQQK